MWRAENWCATADLPHLLEDGTLGGVALDVYDQEPLVADALRLGTGGPPDLEVLRLLARHPRVLLTPHNAFNTQEAVARKSNLTAEQVAAFLRDGRFRWPLVVPAP
jgi:D-lactate dehydrogenase